MNTIQNMLLFAALFCLFGGNALRLNFAFGPVSLEMRRLQSLKLSESAEKTSAVSPPVLKPAASSTVGSEERSYIVCAACKTAYVLNNFAAIRGCKVKCCVCEKEWFQSSERILRTDNLNRLEDMSEKKIAEVKKIIGENNWPRNPRVDKVDIFVGNLPYDYEEKELSKYTLKAFVGICCSLQQFQLTCSENMD